MKNHEFGQITMEACKSVQSRKTLTVPEAAKVLGIGRAAAYEAARSGDLPVIRIGRRLLVPVVALDHLLNCVGSQ